MNSVQSITVNNPLDLIALDYIDKLIAGKFNYNNLWVVVDIFSKYVKLYPPTNCNTVHVNRSINNFV